MEHNITFAGDFSGVQSISLSNKKFVSIQYKDGRIVKFLYNSHFDIKDGKSAYEVEHDK